MNKYDYLNGTQDLSLSDWGPYARDFFTLSHIGDVKKGMRMDFLMVPGICRRKFCPPETLRECDYSPWEASGDFSFFSCRQQMVDHDVFYAETAYCKLSDNFRLGRLAFVNNTDGIQNACLMVYGRFAPRDEVSVELPNGALWLDALEHLDVQYAYKRCDRNLVWNGGRRGEEQNFPGTVGNRCLGHSYNNAGLPCFGAVAGDRACYRHAFKSSNGKIYMRAHLPMGKSLECTLELQGKPYNTKLEGADCFKLYELYSGPIEPGTMDFISRTNGVKVRVDGFVFLNEGNAIADICFPPISHAWKPSAMAGPVANQSTTIRLNGFEQAYTIWWDRPNCTEREYWVDDLAKLLNYSYGIRQPYYNPNNFFGPEVKRNVYCKETYMLPILIQPHSTVVIHTLYGVGIDGDVQKELLAIDKSSDALEAVYEKAHKGAFQLNVTPEGQKYNFSQQLMSAALMTNIAFPIQAKGQNIRHHSPDKYYYTLYSWDSGFIGLGLSELDKLRAIENLNAYVTPPEDEECAFILHGTPVPVQAYLFAELWNRHQDREMLERFYPRVKHFYDFLAGHIESSTFRTSSNLIKGWDYFYNSGGWDDYPPQWQVHTDHLTNIAPTILTSHTIRAAKFLIQAARELGGHEADILGFEADIAALGDALQKYSWSEADKVFSYVELDANGAPTGHFKHPQSGVNYNFGLDGISPLLAGECTRAQEEAMFARLTAPGKLWSPCGISTVDMSAPYFRTDGYWNGCVWMPQQWFFWKACLDYNQGGFARKIAKTALDVWKNEVDQSYYCFEHFSLQNGRGCGCHHFGGLSSPVLCWHHAYYELGRLTCGFDTWVKKKSCEDNGNLTVELAISGEPGRITTLLYVCGKGNWTASFNGQTVPVALHEGCLEIQLPKATNGKLIVSKK
ncbi:MAG: hypothetical protein IKP00_13030 [Victivallales bacterium]|nr:hypothetical protein [Victivallales bacterium]